MELGDNLNSEELESKIEVGKLKKRSICMIEGRPCKVVDISFGLGKFGNCAAFMIGIDIFTGKKYNYVGRSNNEIELPKIEWKRYQVTGIEADDYLLLMDNQGNTRSDVKLLDCNREAV